MSMHAYDCVVFHMLILFQNYNKLHSKYLIKNVINSKHIVPNLKTKILRLLVLEKSVKLLVKTFET